MKKTRFLLIVFTIILIAGLVACNQDQNKTEESFDSIVNLRSAAVMGDWVYHFKLDRSNPEATPGLYKTKLDNSKTELVLEDLGLFFIIEGDWIYYSSISQDKTDAIYKVKTDGTEKTKLADDTIMASMDGKGFQLDGDWLYYLSMNEEGSLYRVNIDSSNREKLEERSTNTFELKDDWIYYNVMEDSPRIYKMKKDGSENTLVFEENAMLMDLSDNYIYFSDESGNKLKKLNLDSLEIKDLNIDKIYLLQAKDNWIYYITQPDFPESDNQLYRAKDDGSEITKLTDDDSFFMKVSDDWIYYISIDEVSSYFKLNKMKTDGSSQETFKAEGILVFLNW